MQPAIVIHGGAGAWDLTSERINEAVSACAAAAYKGQSILLSGGTALDAVEAAVNILEDCTAVDAGRGSHMNAAGEVEMDALIMDGRDLNMGAVAAVQRVRYPISLARRVMTDTEHNFMVADGASAFADSINFPRCDEADLLVGAELERYLAVRDRADYRTVEGFIETAPVSDTVGAVAVDTHGNLAAATSTGGTLKKLPGRVGDSPLVGSGGYADNWTAAVSATGYGEALMKVVISKSVCDFVGSGLNAQAACDAGLRLLENRVDGRGGLIAVDARGQIGFAFNTAAMPHAWAVGSGEVFSGR